MSIVSTLNFYKVKHIIYLQLVLIRIYVVKHIGFQLQKKVSRQYVTA